MQSPQLDFEQGKGSLLNTVVDCRISFSFKMQTSDNHGHILRFGNVFFTHFE